jgi:hypothetical protein
MQIVWDVFGARHFTTFWLDNVLHHGLNAELGIVIIAGFYEEFIEHLSKATGFLLGVWVCFVGFEDEHAHAVRMLGDSVASW